jgi:hypothetical protein
LTRQELLKLLAEADRERQRRFIDEATMAYLSVIAHVLAGEVEGNGEQSEGDREDQK